MELRDPEIRAELKVGLEARIAGQKHCLVVDELGISRGEVRADVAVISPDKFVGYEIKSDFDSLVRLQRQIMLYDLVFDQSYLICGNKFIEKALKILPDHWGLFTLTAQRVNLRSGAGGHDYKLKFTRVREASDNPGASLAAIALLLWKDELVSELKLRGVYKGKSRYTREQLGAALAAHVGHGALREIVARRLSQRVGWR